MAEMIVMAIDKVNAESPYLDAQCYKRGDVIAIKEDGHPWSDEERNHPRWKIVKIPGVAASRLSAFIAEEPGDRKVTPMLQRRGFKFDLDEHERRGSPTYNEGQINALRSRKAARSNPDVL